MPRKRSFEGVNGRLRSKSLVTNQLPSQIIPRKRSFEGVNGKLRSKRLATNQLPSQRKQRFATLRNYLNSKADGQLTVTVFRVH
ncbi:hypothetical protein AVEN_219490-1 [Araneus ventricosus]|uniref:Uncharacterized protein n=1 Tax=Araneus ventricosus TaxID=182803 RepID=A0A4Y2BNU7_ARAVE|nr:hypothetical protein AVEN_219490-1 [Araneus ventricosus]